MHTIKLEVQDSIYEHIMFLLKNINKREIEIISDDEFKKTVNTKMKMEELFKHKNVNLFESIEDPVSWQKNQRDEW